MFSWVKTFSIVMWLAFKILEYLERQRLYDQARLDAARDMMKKAEELINNAEVARDSVSNDADAVRNDPNNRDFASGAKVNNKLNGSKDSV